MSQPCDYGCVDGRVRGLRLVNRTGYECAEEAYDDTCRRCGGAGALSELRLKHIMAGRIARQERLARGLRIRDVASSLGMTAVEYSAFERGLLVAEAGE